MNGNHHLAGAEEGRDYSQELSAFGTLMDVDVQQKAMEDGWLLITYDIPKNEAGDKARGEFLANAWRIGAVPHSESVYYMPWSHQANTLIVSLVKTPRAKVWVWRAIAASKEQAEELAQRYDATLLTWVTGIGERLDRIIEHAASRKLKLAGKMMERTQERFAAIKQTVARRQTPSLVLAVEEMELKLQETMAQLVYLASVLG